MDNSEDEYEDLDNCPSHTKMDKACNPKKNKMATLLHTEIFSFIKKDKIRDSTFVFK